MKGSLSGDLRRPKDDHLFAVDLALPSTLTDETVEFGLDPVVRESAVVDGVVEGEVRAEPVLDRDDGDASSSEVVNLVEGDL
jgi:hypothetical protein